MKHALAAALLGGLLASPVLAQADHVFQIDGPASNITWSGDTSLGSIIENPNNFDLDGTVIINLDATVTNGQMVGGMAYTIPDLIQGTIPNPLPFLPPLAEIDVIDAAFTTTTTPFTLDSAGNFTTDFTLAGVHGTFIVCSLGFETITPVSDLASDPTPVSGNISVTGNLAHLTLPLNNLIIPIDDPTLGITGDVTLNGTVNADADLVNGLMTLDVSALTAGLQGTFAVTDADANTATYLIYSTVGPQNHTVQGLDVGLANPIQIAVGPNNTDAMGDITWNLPIPGSASGLTVWVQAVQVTNNASNVVVTTIQ